MHVILLDKILRSYCLIDKILTYQGPHELEKELVSCQGDGKNMLILENGEKVMKYGLETKGPSFLID